MSTGLYHRVQFSTFGGHCQWVFGLRFDPAPIMKEEGAKDLLGRLAALL